MRILYLSPYPPARDGLATYTAALAGAVRAEGHTVGVIAARSIDGVSDDVIGVLPLAPARLEALRAHIEAWNPDVVHVQFTVAAFTTRVPALLRLLDALRPLRARVFVTLHEVTGDTALLHAVGRAIYRRVTEVADAVIVHTHTSYRELTSRVGAVPARAFVLPHPRMELPAATTTPGELRDRYGLGGTRILLFFGFIHVDKGLDDLVRALHLLQSSQGEAVEDVRIVVAGSVPVRQGPGKPYEIRNRLYLARIRRSILRWGLTERVVFTGYVPAGEIAAWFRLAAAAVLPYRRSEQSGVASLAAGAATPLLISDVGGLAEMAGATRWSFPPRAPEQLARTLACFLRESHPRAPKVRDDLTAPGVAEVASKTLSLYRGCRSDANRTAERAVSLA